MAVAVAVVSAQVNVQFPGGSVDVRKDAAGGTKVDVQHPAGSVNVDKGLVGPAAVDVQHPAGSVNVNGGSRSAQGQQNDLLAVLRSILGLNANAAATAPAAERRSATVVASSGSTSVKAGSKDVHVDYPGGLVNVRQATPGGRKVVDVAYPGGSVNVGGNGNNVDVAFPGGFVKLDPREPGKRRTGVVVFPFGSVRFG